MWKEEEKDYSVCVCVGVCVSLKRVYITLVFVKKPTHFRPPSTLAVRRDNFFKCQWVMMTMMKLWWFQLQSSFHVCLETHTHMCVCVCTYVDIIVYTHTHTCKHIHLRIFVHMNVRM